MNKIFVFPGQGSQIVGMGRNIYNKYSIAKNIFDKVNDLLNMKLTDVMFDGPPETLNMTAYAQIALLSHSFVLFELLQNATNKNISELCSFVSGHSVGEYSALLASQCISLEDAVDLLQERSRLMQEACLQSDGAMAACMNIEPDLLKQILTQVTQEEKGICNIANDNSQNQIVISGHKHLVEQAINMVKQQGAKAIMLKVSGAFHTPLMLSAQSKMREKIAQTNFQDPQVPIIMNVCATPCASSAQIKQKLSQQIVMPVQWRQIMQFAAKNNLEIVEIGASNVLSNLAKRSNYPHQVTNICDDQSLMEFIQLYLT